jgi:hypothetical protein
MDGQLIHESVSNQDWSLERACLPGDESWDDDWQARVEPDPYLSAERILTKLLEGNLPRQDHDVLETLVSAGSFSAFTCDSQFNVFDRCWEKVYHGCA